RGAAMSCMHYVLDPAGADRPFALPLPSRLTLCHFRRTDVPAFGDEAVLWYLVGAELMISFDGPAANGAAAEQVCPRFLEANGYERARGSDRGVYERRPQPAAERRPLWKREAALVPAVR